LYANAVNGHEGVDPTWRELMLKYYDLAMQGDNAVAARNLGQIYYSGMFGQRDFQKAYDYFQRAAELGDTISHFQLGQMHENGEGVPATPIEAAYHYRLAALDGHMEALRRLANFYLEGKGGAQDLERAQFWLTMLVQRGNINGLIAYIDVAFARGKAADVVDMLENLKDSNDRTIAGYAFERLSRCYALGLGVKVKQSRAKSYLDKAVQLGNPDAMYALGCQQMVDKKEQEAVALFAKAADRNCPEACYALGKMHFHGQYVAKDIPKSVAYLRKAADLNHAGALFYLAAMTFNHVPGGPSLDEGIEFARHAEAVGNKEAGPLREKLERRRAQGDKPKETTAARPT
jgi:uncharacterized protein